MTGHPGKREICTHISVMYSRPFPSLLMTAPTFEDNSFEEHETFVEIHAAVFLDWKTINLWRWWWKKPQNFLYLPEKCNKLQNFLRSKLLSFMVQYVYHIQHAYSKFLLLNSSFDLTFHAFAYKCPTFSCSKLNFFTKHTLLIVSIKGGCRNRLKFSTNFNIQLM